MFERGFKSWCENVSLEIRRELKLAEHAALPTSDLASYLGVALWGVHEVVGLDPAALGVLLRPQDDNWSALTVSWDGKDAVVFNSSHSERRQSSDVMHELAHILAGHPPSTVILSADGLTALRTFSRQQEEEANWLSGSLLLPRPALMSIARARQPTWATCDEYKVSEDLLSYRMNVSGVVTQLRRARGRVGGA